MKYKVLRQKEKGKRQNYFKTQAGFTLIEILVVTVILGLLLTVAANVFITILRNQNKTSLVLEIRQNAALVIDTFERDVRSSQRAVVNSPNQLELTLPDATTIDWFCEDEATVPPGENGRISRQVGTAGPVVNVTNTDADNGVSIAAGNCNIFSGDVAAPGSSTIVTMDFLLRQAVASPNKVEFSNTDVRFKTTVGPRGVIR